MSSPYVPAYHCVNSHHGYSVYKYTPIQNNLPENNRIASTSAIPRKHILIAHTDQNTPKANVSAEWIAVLVNSRKVLGLSYDTEMEYLTESVRTFPQPLKTNTGTVP